LANDKNMQWLAVVVSLFNEVALYWSFIHEVGLQFANLPANGMQVHVAEGRSFSNIFCIER
jgi:hypothetical protein